MIELDQVSKHYGDSIAVNALSLTIQPGDFCVFIGTSGCGKSTTLRMINRLIEPSHGHIRIDGEDIAGLRPELLRRRIGYAIQSIGLFPHWTVARNIAVVPQLLGWEPQRIRQRVHQLLELLHLDPAQFADKLPAQLSGGQAQRVGVARALAADPNILLMDEPFGALDPITRDSLQAEMLRIQAELHKTIVFVTHDIDEALKLGNRIVVMDQGRIIQNASPQQLVQHPANDFVANLIGQQDRGLKAAACTTVAELLQPARMPLPTDQPRLRGSDSLKLAVSQMLWHKVDCLPVCDDSGQVIGELSMQRILEQQS